MIAPWLVYSTVTGFFLAMIIAIGEPIMRRRGQSLRWPWLFVVFAIVALPVALNSLPQFPVELMPRTGGATTYIGAEVPLPPTESADPALLVIWCALSSLVALQVIASAISLRIRRRRWVPAELQGTPVLIADDVGPAVIGWGRRATVIPRWALTFDEESRALILQHEAEHIRSGDTHFRSAALVALILMPWNLALWWSVRRLCLAIEIDCDQRVLARGVDRHRYASLLLVVGERMSVTPLAWATAFGGSRSFLEKRIVAMSARAPRHPRLAHAVTIAAAMAAAVIACATPVPEPIVPPPTVKSGGSAASTTSDMVVDTIYYDCEDSPEARADTSCGHPHMYIQRRRRAPKDTVYVVFRALGEIPSSIEMETVCAAGSDCNGYIGDGRRHDTLFVFSYNTGRRVPDTVRALASLPPSLPSTLKRISDGGPIGDIVAESYSEPLRMYTDPGAEMEVVDSVVPCTAALRAHPDKRRPRSWVSRGVYYTVTYKRCE